MRSRRGLRSFGGAARPAGAIEPGRFGLAPRSATRPSGPCPSPARCRRRLKTDPLVPVEARPARVCRRTRRPFRQPASEARHPSHQRLPSRPAVVGSHLELISSELGWSTVSPRLLPRPAVVGVLVTAPQAVFVVTGSAGAASSRDQAPDGLKDAPRSGRPGPQDRRRAALAGAHRVDRLDQRVAG